MHYQPYAGHHREFDPDASLVLVGIRGCGKRSLGFVAAAALKRRFITEDHYFKEVTGLTRHEYLRQLGSQEFQRRDIEVLKMMLDNHRSRCVIECGLGSLTQPVQDHLRLYSLTNPVVYLLRDMDRIQGFLGLDDPCFQFLQHGDPMHRLCSNFEYYNIEDGSSVLSKIEDDTVDRGSAAYSFKLREAKEDFTRFVRFITGGDSNRASYDSPFVLLETPPECRSSTHAIFIRLSNLLEGAINLIELESGGDVIELCVDRWDPNMPSIVSKQVALLRRNSRIPLIMSVDMPSIECGNNGISSAHDSSLYHDILEHGLRVAVEYLAVDLRQDQAIINRIIRNKGTTKIIGHYVFEQSSRVSWEDEGCMALYLEAEKLGCQLVRILRVATDRADNILVVNFVHRIVLLPGRHPPVIAYNIGPFGRTSQLLNPILTWVTHPAIKRNLSNELEPQLTARDLVRSLFHSYMYDPLQFYVIGARVSYSLSPVMHNAAFQHCGMNHTFSAVEAPDISVLDRLSQDSHFGGANIIQPWREHIYHQLAAKSRHAEAIGAVNTIIPLRARADGTVFSLQEQASRRNQAGRVLAWYGENTDWVGMMVCINRNLSPRNAISPLKTSGLVVGAGGMARAAIYALLQLGCRKIFIYNRTVSRAETVANHFNSWVTSSQADLTGVVRVLPSLEVDWPSDACPPSLIISCVPCDPDGDQPAANFEMPTQWLGSLTGGVVLELAYKPLYSPLLRQMHHVRSRTGRPWVLVDGLEHLTEQGIAVFELVTGRKAPRRLMTLEVLRNYVGENGRFDEKTIQARLESIC
ncbi:hypothetical protein MAP00_004342 [Monascus purpureus]|nr:hypothetical protein MAP00_004342 [Monascus purpureus]